MDIVLPKVNWVTMMIGNFLKIISVKSDNEDIGDIDEITGKTLLKTESTDLQIGNFVGQKWTRDDVEILMVLLIRWKSNMITSFFNSKETHICSYLR